MLAWLSSINDNTKETNYNNNMNMTGEDKAIIIIISIIVAGIVFLSTICAGYNLYTTKVHLENGYEEVQAPGTMGTVWVKPNNKEK